MVYVAFKIEPADCARTKGLRTDDVIRAIEFDDEIIDVIIEYPADFAAQMLDYAEKYSHLPNVN